MVRLRSTLTGWYHAHKFKGTNRKLHVGWTRSKLNHTKMILTACSLNSKQERMQLLYRAEAMKMSGVPILALFLVAVVGAAAALSPPNVLYSSSGAEGVLKAGNSLYYGDYQLRLDTDCWLILYGKYMRPLLVVCAGSLGIKNCYLTLDSAGTLFIYGYRDSKLVQQWSSRDRSRIGSYAFVLKYDGTLNIYGPELWKSSNTQFSVSTSNHSADSMSSTTASSLNAALPTIRGTGWTWWPGKSFSIGTIISTYDYKLELLDYCVMITTNTRTGQVVWSTNVWGTVGDCYLSFETNGELMIKKHSGNILWRSGVRGSTGLDYLLSIRLDGVLVVYEPPIKTWTPKKIKQVAGSGGEKIAILTDQLE